MPGNDERKNERTKKIRRRNADRRNSHSAAASATAAPGAPGAHLSAFHRGSRPEESFIARDAAPGFCVLGRGGKVGGLSVERALPASTCPSPAMPSQPGRSARRITPDAARERVASPPAIPTGASRQIQTSYCQIKEICLRLANRSLAFSMSRVAEKPK